MENINDESKLNKFQEKCQSSSESYCTRRALGEKHFVP